ncbi:MAG TPA: DUF1801 domain-containing protein [Herpetosiphonaceae bacterium]|nr:DUF1801 domain-containing protein [Herpetosiphonaceae bacterium]
MKTTNLTVDDYLAGVDEPRRATLSALRAIIRDTVPEASESISHTMPAYDYKGMLCAFAAQKHYLSFYLLNGAVVDQHRHLLAGLSVGKGCIRFKDFTKLPEATIRTLLRAAAEANEACFNDHC